MNSVLQPFLRKFTTVFFNDILIYSDSLQSHLLHLEQVLQTLLHHQFFLKRSKCFFGERRLEYLGHVIFGEGIEPKPSKIVAITQWPVPSSTKDLRAFLGLTGFYRRFIHNYAVIASPLTALLCRDNFSWSPSAQFAFDHLKQAMTSAPVLTPPDFTIPFIIEMDASGVAMGVVLMQNNKPIAYFSKQFTPKLQRASTYTRELHALTAAVSKWRQYLLGHKFVILTDHQSL